MKNKSPSIRRIALSIAVLLSICLLTPCPARAAVQQCSLPPEAIPFQVLVDNRSYTPVELTDVPAGYAVSNGLYEGWCVEYQILIAPGPIYHANLYDTYQALPDHIANLPWDKVNYLLNHKRGSLWDVQYVLWQILGQLSQPPPNQYMVEMIEDVELHGAGFVPTNGQIVGVILDSMEGVQRVVMETIWDDRCRDRIPPAVAFVSPVDGTTLSTAQTVTVTASATMYTTPGIQSFMGPKMPQKLQKA